MPITLAEPMTAKNPFSEKCFRFVIVYSLFKYAFLVHSDCHDNMCTDSGHTHDLNQYSTDILECCTRAALECIPLTGGRVTKSIPGWSELVQPSKDIALFWHNIWMSSGRPHTGIVANIRRTTRAKYHRAIRAAIRNERVIVAEKVADNMLLHKNKDFWSEIKKMRKRKAHIAASIDNIVNKEEIAEKFATSYKHLYSSVTSNEAELNIMRQTMNDQISAGGSDINSDSLVTVSYTHLTLP